MKHDPKRGPWLINGRGGQAISTQLIIERTRTGGEPRILVTDKKSKRTTEVPRKLRFHRITGA